MTIQDIIEANEYFILDYETREICVYCFSLCEYTHPEFHFEGTREEFESFEYRYPYLNNKGIWYADRDNDKHFHLFDESEYLEVVENGESYGACYPCELCEHIQTSEGDEIIDGTYFELPGVYNRMISRDESAEIIENSALLLISGLLEIAKKHNTILYMYQYDEGKLIASNEVLPPYYDV